MNQVAVLQMHGMMRGGMTDANFASHAPGAADALAQEPPADGYRSTSATNYGQRESDALRVGRVR